MALNAAPNLTRLTGLCACKNSMNNNRFTGKAILVAGLLFLFPAIIQAQNSLRLIKGNKSVYAFHEADFIRFKRMDRDHFNSGFINGIYDHAFRIGEDTTRLEWLEKIDLTGLSVSGFKTAEAGRAFIVAGIALFAADAVNTTLVIDRPYTLHRGVVTSTALLCVSGLVMQFVNNNYFKPGRKNRVIVTQW